MKSAFRKDGELLAEIRSAQSSPDKAHVWWLGQSGFLVTWGNEFLLFDPYLSDSLTRKYADTDKPHVRITEEVINPSELDMLSVVTSSHNHTDHLDGETLQKLEAANPRLRLVLPAANIDFAKDRLGTESTIEMVGLDEGESQGVGAFEFHGISAAHNEVSRDAEGRCEFMGFVVKFGPFRIYHSGDTLWHDRLVGQVLPHAPDLALLPINGNKPERRVAGNMNGMEAAAFAKAVGANIVVPCHYDMFEFNTESPDEFEAACQRLGQKFTTLRNGESLVLSKA